MNAPATAPTTQPAAPPRRSFTLLTSGWLLLLSGVWMAITITSPVPLFGAMRGGVVAVLYNGVFAASLFAMGLALATYKPWALNATWAASACYSVDKLLFLLDSGARKASLAESRALLNAFGASLETLLDQAMVGVSLLFLLGWWGLVWVVWRRRGDFR